MGTRSVEFRSAMICSSRLNNWEPKLVNMNMNMNSGLAIKTKMGLSMKYKFPCLAVSDGEYSQKIGHRHQVRVSDYFEASREFTEAVTPFIYDEDSDVSKKPHQIITLSQYLAVADLIHLITSYSLYGHYGRRHILTILATIRTDDHHYDGMIQELIDKARKARSFTKKTSIVLNEVVPCLLKSADCWISSCLIVAENYKESYEKSKKFDKNSLYPHKVPLEDHALYAPCVEVVVQVEFNDVIDKAEGIHSGEDLKAVLQELGSLKSVRAANTIWFPVLLREEDAKTDPHITYWCLSACMGFANY